MEELLNKLIEKGWRPFNHYRDNVKRWWDDNKYFWFNWETDTAMSIRELTSKESWLWQFVCENGYNQYKKNYFNRFSKYGIKWEYRDTSDFEYYVLESALCDEDKLEQFLLTNIKIDG